MLHLNSSYFIFSYENNGVSNSKWIGLLGMLKMPLIV